MKVLIACEFSGTVRDAFTALGHDAISCDILDSEKPGNHFKGDVREILGNGFDLMIAHPPCTRLCVAANRWVNRPGNDQARKEAIEFFLALWNAPIAQIAIENPKGIMSTILRTPDQIIQPWQFGHGEMKATHLWLKNLPRLKATQVVEGREQRIFRNVGPGPNRWKIRSKTYQGIAVAMASQWGFSELQETKN